MKLLLLFFAFAASLAPVRAETRILAQSFPVGLHTLLESKAEREAFVARLRQWSRSHDFAPATETELKTHLTTSNPSHYDLSYYRPLPTQRPGAGILLTYLDFEPKGDILVVFHWNTSGDEKERAAQTEIAKPLLADFRRAFPELEQ